MPERLIKYFDEIDSTNAHCLREAAELPDRCMIVASSQTAGRGRRGRTWVSPAAQNFYGSLLLKQPFGKAKLEDLPRIAGMAVIDALEGLGYSDAWLKWPNDVYVAHRKLAGILAECGFIKTGEVLVLGIGVNLNMPPEELARIDRPATSLFAETGRRYEVAPFADILYDALIKWYEVAKADPLGLFETWRTMIPLVGKQIRIEAETETYDGVVTQILADGSIEIEFPSGERQSFLNGDVSLRI